MTNRILMIVTSHDRINAERATGLWFDEFAHPYEVFRAQGYDVSVASPKGGKTPIDPNSAPAETDRMKFQAELRALENTIPLNDLSLDEFDAVFLPGGHGAMFDMTSDEVGRVIGYFADHDKIIAAVCHGPAGLVSAFRSDGTPVVKGYRLTSFTNEEETAANLVREMPFLLQDCLTSLGAEFVATPNWSDHVQVDRNLVTGQNPQSGRSTAKTTVQLLEKASVNA